LKNEVTGIFCGFHCKESFQFPETEFKEIFLEKKRKKA